MSSVLCVIFIYANFRFFIHVSAFPTYALEQLDEITDISSHILKFDASRNDVELIISTMNKNPEAESQMEESKKPDPNLLNELYSYSIYEIGDHRDKNIPTLGFNMEEIESYWYTNIGRKYDEIVNSGESESIKEQRRIFPATIEDRSRSVSENVPRDLVTRPAVFENQLLPDLSSENDVEFQLGIGKRTQAINDQFLFKENHKKPELPPPDTVKKS